MGQYNIGDRVAWRGINRDYTGRVKGLYREFVIVEIDSEHGRAVLLSNNPKHYKQADKDGGPGGSPGQNKY